MEKIEIRMAGAMSYFTVGFFGLWAFGVIFGFQSFFSNFSLDLEITPVVILPALVFLIFAYVLIVHVIPRFFRGIYYLMTRKPVLIFDQQGLHFSLPVQGLIPWDTIAKVSFIDGYKNSRQFAVETSTISEFTEKLRNRKRLGGADKSPNDKVVKIQFLELGVKEEDVLKAFKAYQDAGYRFEINQI